MFQFSAFGRILEYCSPSDTVSTEQYYIDLYKPEYNILKIAGSLLGFKHSKETIVKLTNRILTEEHKTKLKEHLKRISGNKEIQAKRLERLKITLGQAKRMEYIKRIYDSKGQRVEVFDILNNGTIVYNSRAEAARALGVTDRAVRQAISVLKEKGVN
jgi:group I intron endonuclease